MRQAEEVLARLATATGHERLDAEIAYYHWLIDGILRGLGARAARRCDPVEQRVAEETRDLLSELMVKVTASKETNL